MSGNLVKYGTFDVEEAEENEKELKRGSANFMELSQGKNIIRFVPPLAGKKTFVIVHQHYIEMPGSEEKLRFNCPRVMARQPCPACAAADRLAQSGNPLDRTRAEKFWPRKRIMGNALNRATPELGVQVLGFGKSIHEELIAIRRDDGIDFTNPENGYDISINKEGSGMKTRYKRIQPARSPSPLAAGGDAINALIQSQVDLGRFAVVPSKNELDEQMEEAGGGLDDLTDGPLPEPPISRGTNKAAARPAARTAADDAVDAEFSAGTPADDDLDF